MWWRLRPHRSVSISVVLWLLSFAAQSAYLVCINFNKSTHCSCVCECVCARACETQCQRQRAKASSCSFIVFNVRISMKNWNTLGGRGLGLRSYGYTLLNAGASRPPRLLIVSRQLWQIAQCPISHCAAWKSCRIKTTIAWQNWVPSQLSSPFLAVFHTAADRAARAT